MSTALGYVYIAALSNGNIKVGRSQNAEKRLSTHRGNARILGLTVTDSWTSPLHAEWRSNEDALKKIAADLGGTPESREVFSGVDFAAVVKKASELTFTGPDLPPAPQPERPEYGGVLTPRERAVALAALAAGMTDAEKDDFYACGHLGVVGVTMLVDQGITLDWLHRLTQDKWDPGVDGLIRATRALVMFERRIERILAEKEVAKATVIAGKIPQTQVC